MTTPTITVAGAGIVGLWQALTLARRGFSVRLIERSVEPFAQSASALAGAMLAPYCEAEAADPLVRELGLKSLALWPQSYPGVTVKGTLVVAGTRDRAELVRFARMTDGFEKLDAEELNALEPDLEGRFAAGLHYPAEAHMAPAEAMRFLLDAIRAAGVQVAFSSTWTGRSSVLEPASNSVGFGATVTVKDEKGLTEAYTIVGVDELDLEPDAVSWISPIGKALLAADLGDSLRLADGRTAKIMNIERKNDT